MSESECETTENSILIVDLIVGLSVSARTICSIMMDCQCITTTLIKVPQVGLMPITASRPYGCFLPHCMLADLWTSRWYLWPWCWSQMEAVFSRAPADSWPCCRHTHHSTTPLRFLFLFHSESHANCLLKSRTSTLPSLPFLLHVIQWVSRAPSGTPSDPVYTVIPAQMWKERSLCCVLLTFGPQRGRCQCCHHCICLQCLAAQGSACISQKTMGRFLQTS